MSTRSARRAQERALVRVARRKPSRLPAGALGPSGGGWTARIEFSGQEFGRRPLPVLPMDLLLDDGTATKIVMMLDSGATTSALPHTYPGLPPWEELEDAGVTYTFAGRSERRRLRGRLSFAGVTFAEPVAVYRVVEDGVKMPIAGQDFMRCFRVGFDYAADPPTFTVSPAPERPHTLATAPRGPG